MYETDPYVPGILSTVFVAGWDTHKQNTDSYTNLVYTLKGFFV